MWLVYAEYFLSVIWSYVMAFIIVYWLLSLIFRDLIPPVASPFVPSWHGLILGTTCMLQFATSKLMDSQYDRDLGKNYFWMIWYPLAYWLINIGTTVVAFPQAVIRKKGKRARWVSPDRGVRA